MARQPRDVRKPLACLTILSLAVAACDRAGPSEPGVDAALAKAPAPVVTTVDCKASQIGGKKTLQVAVKLSDDTPGKGVVVTVISPQYGVQCYGPASDPDGLINFTNIAAGAQFLVSLRDEVSEFAPGIEVVPPTQTEIGQLYDTPSLPNNRQVPALLSGGACTAQSPLTWTSWVAKRGDPCVMPGSGLVVPVKLSGGASIATLSLKDPSNNPLTGVAVGVLSPWSVAGTVLTQADACALMPWVDQTKCSDIDQSSGPALFQSLGLTVNGDITLGYAPTTFPVVLEAIAFENGQAYFATISSAAGFTNVQMAPGMCAIARVVDTMDSATPALDIRYTEHSVAMGWDEDAVPYPINSTLIVRGEIWATTAGGTGSFDIWLQYNDGSPARPVRATLTIPAGHGPTCSVDGWTGSGLTGGVTGVGYCARSADQDGVPTDRRSYVVYFVVKGVNPDLLHTAWYELKTVQDAIDPSKNDNLRGSIEFTTLHRETCPVSQNNDGKWDSFRLQNNDGKWDSF